MAMASSTTCHHPHFRLLLHGKDGSIPYLTPELTRLMFCPESECNDENESSSFDDDWKWCREHFILGVAAKDTCVTAMYRTVTPQKRKQDDRDGNGGDRRSAKRARKEQQPSDTTSSTTYDQGQSDAPFKNDAVNTSDTPQAEDHNGVTEKMKPSGYTFITPSQSYRICTLIKSANAADDDNIDSNETSNYLHSYLRIPKYISTMIVPTFSLDYPNTPTSDGNSAESHNKGNKKYEPKKAPPPSSNNHPKKQTQKQQQQQQQQNRDVIPNSTKDTMPINTPHGWQKIRPEQYWDAVTSLTQPVGSALLEDGTQNKSTSSESVCEGAVGLFDHMGSIDRDQLDNLFAEYTANSSSEDGINTVSMTQSPSLESTSPKNGKWDAILQRVTQRTNDWSSRVQNYCVNIQEQQAQTSVKFWTPVQLAASQLPLTALLACPGSKHTSQGNREPNILPSCANLAIVGWDAIRHREFRRQALHNLLATMQSSPSPPQNYIVLSVNDMQSILDIAREGVVSIIGTDLVREWSHGGKALCLDMTFDGGVPVETTNRVIGGMMEMNDKTYARDSSPILSGCKCLACRPRTTIANNNIKSSCSGTDMMVPSFSRAYIHHLIKANEMLAETLLFVHNLHQMLLLFRQLSRAVALDAECRRDGKVNEAMNFEAICTRIEEQLKSSSV